MSTWLRVAGMGLNVLAYWIVFLAGLITIGHAIWDADHAPNHRMAWLGVGLLSLPFLRSVLWLLS